MTKEEWKRIENKLKSFYDFVKLKCDNYEITLVLQRISQYQNAIAVYVDGKIKSEWLKECEISERFYMKRSKALYTRKEKMTKKEIALLKKVGIDYDKKFYYYQPYWKSFNSLRSHLIKNNSNIVLIEEG